MVNLPRFKYSHTILYLLFNINKNQSIYRVSFRKDLLGTHRSAIRELKQRRRRRQRQRQKSNKGFDKQNNNFARASRFFVHFLAAVVARLQRESA